VSPLPLDTDGAEEPDELDEPDEVEPVPDDVPDEDDVPAEEEVPDEVDAVDDADAVPLDVSARARTAKPTDPATDAVTSAAVAPARRRSPCSRVAIVRSRVVVGVPCQQRWPGLLSTTCANAGHPLRAGGTRAAARDAGGRTGSTQVDHRSRTARNRIVAV